MIAFLKEMKVNMNDSERYEGIIVSPPTEEQIQDLRTHDIGMAIRLASKLGRPLEEWEYDIFLKIPSTKVHELVELPNGRIGVA